jgi:hypothetical protein
VHTNISEAVTHSLEACRRQSLEKWESDERRWRERVECKEEEERKPQGHANPRRCQALAGRKERVHSPEGAMERQTPADLHGRASVQVPCHPQAPHCPPDALTV